MLGADKVKGLSVIRTGKETVNLLGVRSLGALQKIRSGVRVEQGKKAGRGLASGRMHIRERAQDISGDKLPEIQKGEIRCKR